MISILGLFALANIFLTSCQDHLSREEAEKQLTQKLKLPYPLKGAIKIEVYSYSVEDLENQRKSFEKLKDMGFINYIYTPPSTYTDSNSDDVQEIRQFGSLIGTLTESGKIYAVSNKYDDPESSSQRNGMWIQGLMEDPHHVPTDQDIDVLLATISFGEVTGIVERHEEKEAEVNYTLTLKETTPLAAAGVVTLSRENWEYYNQSTVLRRNFFVKYDDGWRLREERN